MRPNVKNTLLLVVLMGLLTQVTGCALFSQESKPSDARRDAVAQIVARRGTYEVLKAHPDLRDEFRLSVTALDNLLINPEIDYDDMVAALQTLPVDQLRDADGALMIRDAIDLYDAVVGDTIRLREGTSLRTFVVAVRNGIAAGISLSAPTETSSISPPPGLVLSLVTETVTSVDLDARTLGAASSP